MLLFWKNCFHLVIFDRFNDVFFFYSNMKCFRYEYGHIVVQAVTTKVVAVLIVTVVAVLKFYCSKMNLKCYYTK